MTEIPDDQWLTYVADIAGQLAALCRPRHRDLAAALSLAADIARHKAANYGAKRTNAA